VGQASHFEPVGQVASGRATILTRALGDDRRPVILKQLRGEHPSQREVRRLENELEIGHRLAGSGGTLEVLGEEVVWGKRSLVLEDFAGRSLDQLLGEPMEPRRFLRLAVNLAGALAEVHRSDVVHRDLKPANIIVNEALGVVKIADFGIASLIPVEHLAALPLGLIEGTPPYMSPEQTGRMNRAVDYRTDLYSLGVIFYEMLTGRLPFEGRDTLEWFHAHLAKAPRDPTELVPQMPPLLAAITLRLLAKAAEDRYQSAVGLKADLERCLALLEGTGAIAAFPLGQHDFSERFQIPQNLYGRGAELAELQKTFDRVAESGRAELLMVAGYSGIGKSCLVHELHKPVVRERGYFLSGKFDQYRRDVPYATIAQAFRELVQQILGESEARAADWRRRLTQALGVNGRLIIDIIPELEMVIGAQPEVPELPPTQAQSRLQIVFERFLGACATREHPLVLFLDDLQWVDTASLALLEYVITHPETRFLLIIGAYRDNEVSASHPLMATLERIEKAGVNVETVTLDPLSRAELRRFVADTFHCDTARAEPLARLVHDKTHGNPFFFIQFLSTLHEEGLIGLDRVTASWTWDVERIEAHGFTDNVVELMVARLARLPVATRDALRYGACLGNEFRLDTLSNVCQRPGEEVEEALRAALREGLLALSAGTYRFGHDRVQQAAYALTGENERPGLHLRIGRLLLASTPPDQHEEAIFDLVNQLSRGSALVTDAAEREALCWLSFRAGRRAKASSAYASARSYLAEALALLPGDAWVRRYQETLELHLELSECEHLGGNLGRASELHDRVLEEARSDPDRAQAYARRIRLYQASGRYEDAVPILDEALRKFGIELPGTAEQARAAFMAEHAQVTANLRGRSVAELLDAPRADDPVAQAVVSLLTGAIGAIYSARPHLFPLVMVRAVNQSLRYGNTPASCLAYSGYAMVLVGAFGDARLASEFSELSLRLNERFADAKSKGRTRFIHANFINPARRHIATSRPMLEQSLGESLEVGDLETAAYASVSQVLQGIERGDRLDEVIELADRCAALTQQNRVPMINELSRVGRQCAACLKGATRGEASFDDGSFSEAACLQTFARGGYTTGAALFHIAKQIAAVHLGRWEEALESASKAAPILGAVIGLPSEATYHFCRALALAALEARTPPERRQELVQTLETTRRKLERWAENCPENFRHRQALVSAELARIEARPLDAERLYEDAIRSAHENGFVHNEALASALASRFYRERGLATSAEAHLRNARAGYARWGADAKVRELDAHLPPLEPAPAPTATGTVTTEAEGVDLLTTVKASQAISSPIVLDQLLETLMRVVMENAGGQRGFLLLPREGGGEVGLGVAAEAVVSGQAVHVRLRPEEAAAAGALPWSIINYVHRSHEDVLLPDAAAPGPFLADDYLARERPKSLLCLPILRQSKVIGLLYLENNLATGVFTPDRVRLLQVLSAQMAISLENSLLFQHLTTEIDERQRAEEARRYHEAAVSFLADASAALSESLDYESTLVRLARLAVSFLADWCAVDVLEDGKPRRVAAAHRDPEKEKILYEFRRAQARHGPPRSLRVLEAGQSLLYAQTSDDNMAEFVPDPEVRELARAIGTDTVMLLPLRARDRNLGAIIFASAADRRRYGPRDLTVASELARRAALAIDNARLYSESRAAVAARDDFLRIASHELKTPLSPLTMDLGFLSDVLAKDPLDRPSALTAIARARRQTARLESLIDEMREVALVGRGDVELEWEDVDLAAVVRDVVARLAEPLGRARSSLDCQAAAPVVGRWDRVRLAQIATNLLSNAIKFGEGKPLEVVVQGDETTARLSVRDHGIGIAAEDQERVFTRFERVQGSGRSQGFGVGLWMVRQIVEALGGTICVESALGAGSTFTVELPRSPASSS
jgi:predicted ATPase/signal transduction histidine kinase